MGPDLAAVEKRKISSLCRESNPGRPACSAPLYRLSYPGYKHEREAVSKSKRLICLLKEQGLLQLIFNYIMTIQLIFTSIQFIRLSVELFNDALSIMQHSSCSIERNFV
jgi:hypothetical protein